MSIPLHIIIIMICVLGEAFFSGSEMAIVSVDKIQLRHASKKGHKPSALTLKLLKKPEWILGTTLLGTNVATITSTTVSASLFYKLLGPMGIPVSIVIMSFVNWIFCEIVPKSIFQQLTDYITPRIAFVIRFFSFLFFPFIWLFLRISKGITVLFTGKSRNKKTPFVTREEMKHMMAFKQSKSDVKPSERQMINRLLDFSETEVSEIMVPLIDVKAISDKATVRDASKLYVETKHRRLPVFHKRIDRIVGILNSFDILGEKENKKIKSFIRKAYYVPPNKKAAVLLKELQNNGINIAIIVDEFGGTEGIVTIEDILEEVVGEIEDEYDEFKPEYKIQKDGSIVVNARMSIDEINERFKLKIPKEDYETIGGYAINKLNRIPHIGEVIEAPDSILYIQRATERSIVSIKIKKKKIIENESNK
ncbi:MAG TPA: hemolysin family protein [Acidobacteriota bacterium]|nr:hemolysin family protein [Acidobacteriota bacterium]